MCVFAMTGNILVSDYTYSVCAILDCVLCLELGPGCKMAGCFTPIQYSSLHVFGILSCMGSPARKKRNHFGYCFLGPSTHDTIFFFAYVFICKTINCDQSHDLPM